MSKSNRETPPAGGRASLDRRAFLGGLGAGAASIAASSVGLPAAQVNAGSCEVAPDKPMRRRMAAREVRMRAAQMAFRRTMPDQVCNGEEQDYPFLANYSKGLPHDALGEVHPAAYAALLAALGSGDPADFESIPLEGGRKLTNPQSGLAFDLEGPDSQHMTIRPAPRIDGPEAASELAELYWMSLARDVGFTDYDADPIIAAAAADLSSGFSDFRGPKQGGAVTPSTIFRGFTPGDLKGPYLSQFMLLDAPFGSLTINQRQRTVVPGVDYLASYSDWLDAQNGFPAGADLFDPAPRYMRNLRDLGQYVHVDALYEAYFNACLILMGLGAPLNPGNPYAGSATQIGFGTFGGPHILSLVTEVATRALKCVWFQKWFVHRRQRPEAFAGLVHNHMTGAAVYPIHPEILNSDAAQAVASRYGTFLLPQAYPDGSPTHPAYGAGHATVAGACVTILKAVFDETFVLPDAVVPDHDGLALVPYTGPGAGELTVGGELNKLAANVAVARNGAGIHYRSDYTESVRLGEETAIGILEEQKLTYNERASFSFTRFDGTPITI